MTRARFADSATAAKSDRPLFSPAARAQKPVAGSQTSAVGAAPSPSSLSSVPISSTRPSDISIACGSRRNAAVLPTGSEWEPAALGAGAVAARLADAIRPVDALGGRAGVADAAVAEADGRGVAAAWQPPVTARARTTTASP